MKLSSPELLIDAHAFLGEGPYWDAVDQQVCWVDIFAGSLHQYDIRTEQDVVINLGNWIGCAAPTKNGGIILGMKNGLSIFQRTDGTIKLISEPEKNLTGNRFNDGKCSPSGQFIAGTMDNNEVEKTGSLYSLDQNGNVRILLSDLGISNGLTWSPDNKVFYFIDTPTRSVTAFDYDIVSGEIANPRIVIKIPAELGWPDGMTSDSSGNLWIALWGGASVTVWNPADGKLINKISFPAKNVTSCVFGGSGLNKLFVTTACKGLDDQDLQKYPQSGGFFSVETNVIGSPTYLFG